MAPLEPYFDRIRHAFLIGEAAKEFSGVLDGKVPFVLCGGMQTAIKQAGDMALAEALPGATVLLSPACASFDQYRDFEARGDHFRTLVQAL